MMQKDRSQKETSFSKNLQKAAALCSRSEKCVYDIRQKLAQWQSSEQDTEKIINTLIAQNFINHERYCSAFVNDKLRLNRWGKLKIQANLRQKRIENNLIQTALTDIDEKEYSSVLTDLIAQKNRQLTEQDYQKRRIKLLRFASFRGFEADLCYKVISDLFD